MIVHLALQGSLHLMGARLTRFRPAATRPPSTHDLPDRRRDVGGGGRDGVLQGRAEGHGDGGPGEAEDRRFQRPEGKLGHRRRDVGRDGAGPDRFFHRHQPAGLFDRGANSLRIQWRLLYNAITRAQRSCLVLVQSQELVDAPAFVP